MTPKYRSLHTSAPHHHGLLIAPPLCNCWWLTLAWESARKSSSPFSADSSCQWVWGAIWLLTCLPQSLVTGELCCAWPSTARLSAEFLPLLLSLLCISPFCSQFVRLFCVITSLILALTLFFFFHFCFNTPSISLPLFLFYICLSFC